MIQLPAPVGQSLVGAGSLRGPDDLQRLRLRDRPDVPGRLQAVGDVVAAVLAGIGAGVVAAALWL